MESCTLFEVKLPDERVLQYQGMCRKVKLTVQDQQITNDLFLLPLENYDVVLGIEWLQMFARYLLELFKIEYESYVEWDE